MNEMANTGQLMVGTLVGNPILQLGTCELPKVESIVYLGVCFKLNAKLSVDYSQRCRKFLASVCCVLRNKVVGFEDIFAHVLVRKCLPILNYGLDCVLLDYNSINVISKSWNTAFRWLFNLGKFESTRLLFQSHSTMSMKYLLDMKLLCFVFSCISLGSSSGMLMKTLSQTLIHGDLNKLLKKYHLTLYYNIKDVKRAVHTDFDMYCNDLVPDV